MDTPRLRLRAPRPGDLHDLFAVFGDAQTMRYWSTPPDRTPDQTRERLDGMIAAADRGPLTYFVIEKDGRAIGTAGLYRGTEIGFILHREHWRQGLGYEAMAAIIPRLWAITDVPELTADADPRNDASIGLLKSLGFAVTGQAERTFCIDGEWADSVYLSLPRPAD